MRHLHDYILIGENDDAMVEKCSECPSKLVTRKDKKGRNDNRKYLETHIRATAQPDGRTGKVFERYYGRVVGSGSKIKVVK